MPFAVNEQGRLKKTQVLDHIIKMKNMARKKTHSIELRHKKQNEETFINYLVEEKKNEKIEKQKLKMSRLSESGMMAKGSGMITAVSEEEKDKKGN